MSLQSEFKEKIKNIAPNTMKNYLTYISKLPFQSLDEVRNLDEDKLIKILIDEINNSSERSRVMCRSAFVKLLTLVGRSDLSLRLPKYKQPIRRVAKKFLTFEQILKIIRTCDEIFKGKDAEFMKLVIMVQYDACCRISALLKLKYQDIIFEDGFPVKVIISEEKVGRLRTVTLSESTAVKLKEFITKNNIVKGYIFNKPYITVYKKQKKLFRVALGKEGDKVSSHWFRASRAVHLFWNGADVDTVKRVGDWDSATVLTYLNMAGVESEEIMQNFPIRWD
jgi:integrase